MSSNPPQPQPNAGEPTSDVIARVPRPTALNAVYRGILRATRMHGLGTLSRLNVKLFPNGERVRLTTGLDFYIPPDPHFFGYVLGNHEHHITHAIRKHVRPGDLCVDAGANIGYFALMMAGQVGGGGEVIAYEPESRNYRALSRNADATRGQAGKVTAVNAAVSDAAGSVTLHMGPESTGHSVAAAGSGGDGAGDATTVPCVRIDDDVESRRPGAFVRFMKMDVEGYEETALAGCERLIAAGRLGAIVVEVMPESAKPVEAFLKRFDAKIACWIDHTWRNDVPLGQIPYRTDALIEFPAAAAGAGGA